MPQRDLAVEELADLFGVLGHPQRVRIIEELRDGEHDVNFLTNVLGCAHSRVSQHLSLLKAHRLVRTRRDGRHVFYRLANPRIATWLLDGLDFTEAALLEPGKMRMALDSAREAWGDIPEASGG
jgi:DNA-binding transcriptional ArsR family regulator